MIDIKQLLTLSKEHRTVLQEIIGYSVANELNQPIFSEGQRKIIEERMHRYCQRNDAVFRYEDIKAIVLDKLK